MTTEVLVAPDAAALLVAYLNPLVVPPVAQAVPDPRPDEFVSFVITGGAGRHDLVLHDVTVSIDCWSTSAHDAHELARLIDAHITAAPRVTTTIRDVNTYGGPADFPDVLSGKPRARATYSLTLRAKPLT